MRTWRLPKYPDPKVALSPKCADNDYGLPHGRQPMALSMPTEKKKDSRCVICPAVQRSTTLSIIIVSRLARSAGLKKHAHTPADNFFKRCRRVPTIEPLCMYGTRGSCISIGPPAGCCVTHQYDCTQSNAKGNNAWGSTRRIRG